MNRHSRTTVALYLLALGLVLAGCTKKHVAHNEPGSADVYTLVSVNGKSMPATVAHDGVTLEVRSGMFTINADGTCRSKTVFVPPTGSEIAREVQATYTKDGATLTMQWEGAGTTVGTVQGDTFTMDNEGMVFVYKK